MPQELIDAMEEALQHYKKNLQQKESQLQYFQALANHIDLSVLVYSSETGKIEWMNQAARIQTGLNFAETVDDLAVYHPELPARLRILHPGELSILQVRRKEGYSQLILSAMSFVVLGKPLTVVSMKTSVPYWRTRKRKHGKTDTGAHTRNHELHDSDRIFVRTIEKQTSIR